MSIALAGCVLVSAAACGSSSSDGGGKASSVTIGATAEPATLDLTTTPAAAIPQALLYNTYEGLVKLDENGAIQPLLAERWEVSDGGRTYTFHLRKDAEFSNGTPFTAETVKYSIERVLAPDSKHPFASQMAPVSSVTAKDEHTAVVELSERSNEWLYSMTGSVGVMLDESAVSSIATKAVGTGPYTLGSWDRGNSLTLKRNPDYWGSKPAVPTVVFRYFDDPNAMNNAMLSGDLDVISNVQAPQTLGQFKQDPAFGITVGTTNGEVVLAMNNTSGPLADARVRRAILHAVDREALVKTVWSGYGKQIGSMVPPTDPWFEDLSDAYPYDPAKAKRLLAKAGHAGGLDLTLKLPTLPYATGAGQFVASQLKEVGINASISQLEFPARWLDVVFTKADYDLSIVSHVEPHDIAKYGDPSYYWRYRNPQVSRQLAAADAAPTKQRQVTLMQDVARTVSADAASGWLFLLPNIVVTRDGVTGFPENAVSLSFDVTGLRASEP